jgi:DNA (cytosine-5)-methyltransferase 1
MLSGWRIGSLFSGIGGLELGLELAGLGSVIWQCEVDPFCRSVLAKHWPNAERFEDIRGVNYPPDVEVLCGGFPCQDISSAGTGKGLVGERSGLWFEFARIVEEITPKWIVIENVASGAKRWVDQVCAHLEQLGYEALPVPLSAQAVGAPHLRNRIFIMAYAISNSIWFESEWLSARRSNSISGERETKLVDNGEERVVAYASSERFQSGRVETSCWKRSASGGEFDGCCSAWADCARGSTWISHSYGWASEPPVCGMDDGVSTKLDRARIKALGNSVVPQCAEVIGCMIRKIEELNALDLDTSRFSGALSINGITGRNRGPET